MAKRLNADEKKVADLFGIEFDDRRPAPTRRSHAPLFTAGFKAVLLFIAGWLTGFVFGLMF